MLRLAPRSEVPVRPAGGMRSGGAGAVGGRETGWLPAPVGRGETARPTAPMRRGKTARPAGPIGRGSRPVGGRCPRMRHRRAVRADVAPAVRGGCQLPEGHGLLLMGAVRPGCAQAVGTVTSGGRAGPGWPDGWPGARGGRPDDIVGEALQATRQRPGVGGGSDTAKAKDHGNRDGGGPDGPGPEPRWWRLRRSLARCVRHAELVTERGQGAGLTLQFVTDGLVSEPGQRLYQRPQLRRRAGRQFRAREQGGQGRVPDHGDGPAARPQGVKHVKVRNITAGHSVTPASVKIAAIRRRPRWAATRTAPGLRPTSRATVWVSSPATTRSKITSAWWAGN